MGGVSGVHIVGGDGSRYGAQAGHGDLEELCIKFLKEMNIRDLIFITAEALTVVLKGFIDVLWSGLLLRPLSLSPVYFVLFYFGSFLRLLIFYLYP